MNITETEATVLAHHGITALSADALPAAAREAGLIYACLGCGTVGGIDPLDGEAARVATRDAMLAADPHALECCGPVAVF